MRRAPHRHVQLIWSPPGPERQGVCAALAHRTLMARARVMLQGATIANDAALVSLVIAVRRLGRERGRVVAIRGVAVPLLSLPPGGISPCALTRRSVTPWWIQCT